MRILVLYEELADYFVNCLNALATLKHAQVLVFRREVNPVAPFVFEDLHPSVTMLDRSAFSTAELLRRCEAFEPEVVYLAGWSYAPYIKVIRKLRRKKTVIGFDNHYHGTFRQRLGILYFRFFLKPFIGFAFVPGSNQKKFAMKLGFSEQRIATGAYCCNLQLFDSYYQLSRERKTEKFPRRFLYVGRYAREKGLKDLWQAFIEFQQKNDNDWELWCVGKGDLEPVKHPKIRHLGFLQPAQLAEVIKSTGVFVLPSTFEPWGVVVHEYATAGFPLLLCREVGSAEAFLQERENGYSFEKNRPDQILEVFKAISRKNDQELMEMGAKSRVLAEKLTPARWVQRLGELLKM